MTGIPPIPRWLYLTIGVAWLLAVHIPLALLSPWWVHVSLAFFAGWFTPAVIHRVWRHAAEKAMT